MSREATKLARIAAAVAVMLGVVFAAGSLTPRGYAPWAPANVLTVDSNALPGEAETFRPVSNSMALKESSQQKGGPRTLHQFDTRRAFPGAPPVIPHELLEDRSMGGKGCLGCHADGGFVPPFKAYAPVTPHPDLLNCRQCHVPRPEKPQSAFAGGSAWQKVSGPAVDQEAMPGAPPPIPHSLQMRGNCVACHAGPGAVAEIRTPHPERANCRQCHVPTESSGAFERGGAR
jgi:cytochrome c-type protein NapB